MGSAPSPPAVPTAQQTATAQTGENVSTAIANSELSHTNQTDQYGNSITYTQNGSSQMTDPQDGTTYNLPNYTENTTMSAANQAIYNTDQQTQQNMANIGSTESAKMGALLDTPMDTSAAATNQFLNTSWEQPFNNLQGQQQEQFQQQMADQGVTAGSQAYTNAQQNFMQSEQSQQDTYDSAMYGQAQSAMMADRQEPINELDALESGSQVANPSFTNTPSTTVPTTDFASIQANTTNEQMQAYNASLANSNAAMGGMFGLGGSLISGGLMF